MYIESQVEPTSNVVVYIGCLLHFFLRHLHFPSELIFLPTVFSVKSHVNLPIILANLTLPSGFVSKDVCLENYREITSQVNGLVARLHLNNFYQNKLCDFQLGLKSVKTTGKKKVMFKDVSLFLQDLVFCL